MFKSLMFPNCLKLTVARPLQKRQERVKSNLIQSFWKDKKFVQISTFVGNVFLKYQWRFWKGYRTQHSNLKTLKNGNNVLGKENIFDALLTDISKVFDCLDHKLLTAKSNAKSFNLPVFRLLHDYLSNRRKRIKNENLYSTWTEIVFGVTILRPLLFNIFLAYLFFIISNIGIASYADDNMPCIAADSINGLITGKASTASFQWFNNNLLKTILASIIY